MSCAGPIVAVFAMLVLAGCASETPETVSAGADTYTVTERASVLSGGADVAAKAAFEKAHERCKQDRLAFLPITTEKSSSVGDVATLMISVTVTFRCVPSDMLSR